MRRGGGLFRPRLGRPPPSSFSLLPLVTPSRHPPPAPEEAGRGRGAAAGGSPWRQGPGHSGSRLVKSGGVRRGAATSTGTTATASRRAEALATVLSGWAARAPTGERGRWCARCGRRGGRWRGWAWRGAPVRRRAGHCSERACGAADPPACRCVPDGPRDSRTTRSRSFIPGLKCTVYLAGNDTGAPVLGCARPVRGANAA